MECRLEAGEVQRLQPILVPTAFLGMRIGSKGSVKVTAKPTVFGRTGWTNAYSEVQAVKIIGRCRGEVNGTIPARPLHQLSFSPVSFGLFWDIG